MATLLHSSISVGHLLAALVALAAGTSILVLPKGTRRHRLLGRVYVGSMSALLLTAFQLYFLFGRFGIVHWGAVGSSLALFVGVGAVCCRRVVAAWQRWHYLGMGASVTGLYAAFAVESTYRLFPPSYFWGEALGLAAAVFMLGGVLLYRHAPAAA
ncbi:hypothetical protein GO988_05205 [Hymenobacter sp. HMF4947]|uniref:DUF2306 domain-containing protein n=1 Tax=Hymenobacter ginkgonis TaxID=2682976 RepID=A0A7K1TBD2_9BACT|nr:hypothetical protein [Hymenobacter ginkgonis]MVN75718.1 hypothetical protein [Hymenobacter ginkgonis]